MRANKGKTDGIFSFVLIMQVKVTFAFFIDFIKGPNSSKSNKPFFFPCSLSSSDDSSLVVSYKTFKNKLSITPLTQLIVIGSNSKLKKFKKTWIERCRHLCVCPLIDHRREPIRMRELLGLLYNTTYIVQTNLDCPNLEGVSWMALIIKKIWILNSQEKYSITSRRVSQISLSNGANLSQSELIELKQILMGNKLSSHLSFIR